MQDDFNSLNGGIQAVFPGLASPMSQIVYLNFDGAETSYCNRELDIAIDNIVVRASGIDDDNISIIVDSLNETLGENVIFTTNLPLCNDYSTVFIGKTDAFSGLGAFLGLAENIDFGNHHRNDNAFVFLDSTASVDLIVSVIAHETEHIVCGSAHAGEGIQRFAFNSSVPSNTLLSNTNINSGDNLYVYGYLFKTTVNSKGGIHVYNGGEVLSTTVNSGGYLYVYSGGIALCTDLKGELYVSSGGTARETLVNSCGELGVSNGGSISQTTVKTGGRLWVSSGGTALNTIAEAGVNLDVFRGVTFSGTTINSGASLILHGGGSLTNTTVNSGGSLSLPEGGILSNTTINGVELHTPYGCVLTNTKVDGGGTLFISSGGTANGGTINGSLHVSSGGTANNTTLYGRGYVSNGGMANSTAVSGLTGCLDLYSGGVINQTIVDWGILHIWEGGVANQTTMKRYGEIHIMSGGIMDEITLSSGYFTIGSGGTATNIDFIKGNVVIQAGAHVSFKDTSGCWDGFSSTTSIKGLNISETVLVFSGGTVEDSIITSRGSLYVFSGTASNTSISSGGMIVFDNGITNHTIINSYGCSLDVCSGGLANDTIVNSSFFRILDGGMANNTLVNSGYFDISSGGVANSTIFHSGLLQVSSGGTANALSIYSGGYQTIYGTINDTDVYSGATPNIHIGGIANSTTIHADGKLNVYSSGIANSTTIHSGGKLNVYSSGIASYTTIYSGSILMVGGGGTAISTTIHSGGNLTVSNGGTANGITINYGCDVFVEMNCNLAQAIINSGGSLSTGMYCSMNQTIINSGGSLSTGMHCSMNQTTINSGGSLSVVMCTMEQTTINSGGCLSAGMNCTMNQTTINSGGILGKGLYCTMNNTTINSGGSLDIGFGDKHSGILQIESGGIVSAYNGATIDFSITEQEDHSQALINRFDYIQGANNANYTITLGSEQSDGDYALAGCAQSFNASISIITSSGTTLGVVTREQILTIDDRTYSLSLTPTSTLHLTISAVGVATSAMTSFVQTTFNDGKTVIDWREDETTAWSQYYDMVLSTTGGTIILNSQTTVGLEILNAQSGNMSMKVKPSQSVVWTNLPQELTIQNDIFDEPMPINADNNGMTELMFAKGKGVWSGSYQAKHMGSGEWSGTGQVVSLEGKNILDDIFSGSNDTTVLLLTDDTNGDALFVDDIYSAFPAELDVQARIAQIDDIRAGAGNDIVDLTSQRFEYIGGGMTVRGGLGDDVIWANKGDNWLFGDAGNDNIVGAGGNDIIVGGAGNDPLHGGGGNDIFAFGGEWGTDTVAQLETGKVTLWFANGDESKWNADSLTYTDGDNSVKVSGVALENISLKFGDDGSQQYQDMFAAGAFNEFTSEKIFEDKNRGMLA